MEELDCTYEATLDYYANRKQAELEAESEPEKEPLAYCIECDAPIDEDGGDWYYSKHYHEYICGRCLDNGYGERGRR